MFTFVLPDVFGIVPDVAPVAPQIARVAQEIPPILRCNRILQRPPGTERWILLKHRKRHSCIGQESGIAMGRLPHT